LNVLIPVKKAILSVALLLTLLSCDRPCGCGPSPQIEPFNFKIIDSTGANLVDSESWVQQYYYLKDGYKTPIGDIYRRELHVEDTTVDAGYYFQTDIPVTNALAGIKESYIEIVPGDIDTIFIEAVREDDMHRSVTEVRFNGVPCTKDPRYPSFIWQIPKNMKK
jgi:hypothetical protein